MDFRKPTGHGFHILLHDQPHCLPNMQTSVLTFIPTGSMNTRPPPPDPCNDCTCELPSWAQGLIVFFAILAALSISLNIFFIYRKRRLQDEMAARAHMEMRKRKDNAIERTTVNGIDQNQVTLRRKTIALKKSRIEIPRENIGITVSLRSIGDGLFGNVWKGETSGLTVNDGDVIPVAARELPESLSKEEILRVFTPLWRLQTHENVVQLYGCCLQTNPSYVLSEYVTNGTLLTYLRTNCGSASLPKGSIYVNVEDGGAAQNQLTPMEQHLLAFDIANGMDYLAGKKIVHGKLCAHNVLLTKERRCKVADFGLASHIIQEKTTQNNISRRWMPPERMLHGLLTAYGDVWAFGVVVWEIMTSGKLPYADLRESDILRKIQSGYRLPQPHQSDSLTYEYVWDCWRENVNDRPTFETLKDRFGGRLEEEADYFAVGSNMESYYACVDIIDI